MQTILQDNISPSVHVALSQLKAVPADVSYLLGKPPLECLWKVMFRSNLF